jgi:phytoene dehydrogenase-like protein
VTLGSARSAPDRFDAVLIGSGINSLLVGATLAKAGWSVGVFEREPRLGGAIFTAPIDDSRFRHECYSQTHTQFTTSPAYAYLREDLESPSLMLADIAGARFVSRGDPPRLYQTVAAR